MRFAERSISESRTNQQDITFSVTLSFTLTRSSDRLYIYIYISLGSCLVERFTTTSKFIITFTYAASNGFGFAIYFNLLSLLCMRIAKNFWSIDYTDTLAYCLHQIF